MVEQMTEQTNEQQLSEILKAVSDITRRSLLTSVVQEGPIRVTDLANQYDISLNAVSKHIKVLESAGLVTRKTVGRVHLIEANLGPVTEIDNWFEQLRSIWDLRLSHLEKILLEENKEGNKNERLNS
jgi:DNA-binding transcriptional ArsR family regulator